MSRICPVYVPYLSRICLVSYKIRDICETTARHIQKTICFSRVCQYIGGIQAIINPKTILMAKLSGPLQFEGKLDELSAYKMKGCESTVLSMGWGSSKKSRNTIDGRNGSSSLQWLREDCSSEVNPPLPLQGGDASAQPLLFEDAYENENTWVEEKRKRIGIGNHPLLGWAKLRNTELWTTGVGSHL